MRYIDKTKEENRIEGLRINRQMLDAHWRDSHYINLYYDVVDKNDLIYHLVKEQEGYCCYCMRRLYIQKEGNHEKNVTLKHVIPHKITPKEWEHDRAKYRQFSNLRDDKVTVCLGGKLIDPKRRFGMPPFPHFIAYDNLVASCNGQTLNEDGEEIKQHCCNNMRGNNYVEPLYFHSNVAEEIGYDGRGHIICAEEYVPYLQKEIGVNIMSPFLNRVRLFWKQVADSEYTVEQLYEAESDEELRQNIIDDIFVTDLLGEWQFLMKRKNWSIYLAYDWFCSYYGSKNNG